MKKAKITKQLKKKEKPIETSEYSLKNLVIIIVSLLVIFALFYLITTLIVKPASKDYLDNSNEYQFNFTKIILNHLLDRPEDEYYVIAVKKSDSSEVNQNANYKVIYSKYIQDYRSKEDALTFYNVDLSELINKSYVKDETNITDNLNELTLSDDVLFKIKKGKIDKYYVGSENIIKALSDLTK